MAVIVGLEPSYNHVENGMTKADMRACKQVADRHNEVIIFRSTGPWSKRWIEKGYPTKNFHVKGKSSDEVSRRQRRLPMRPGLLHGTAG